jgi:Domain of unknown function (DUF4365)
MAELFLQNLEPTSIARPPVDFGYDFLVGFANKEGGINYFAVEVKATDRFVPSLFIIDRRTYDLLAHSSIRGFLLVVDVKHNDLFFGWPPRVDTRYQGSGSVGIPMTKINDATKTELRQQLTA